MLRHPSGVAVGPDGTIWIVDNNSYLLRSVTTDGVIHTNATGFEGPQGVAVAPNGTVYVADRGSYRVVRPGTKGKLVGVAGDPLHPGFRGDGGQAKRAWLWQPYDVATDAAGNLYIADTSNQRIRMVDAATGKIRTIVGNGKPGFTGDGGPARDAELYNPEAIAVDPAGTVLYIADYTNARLRRVDLVTGIITTVAGVGSGSVSYDSSLTGAMTPLTRIIAVALDASGNVYLPVFYNNLGTLVMRLDPSGTMTRVVGGGTSDALGGPASEFRLPTVEALEINPFTGELLICVGDGRILAIPDVATITAP
jgi:sugar lactone lactonase YvrE